MPFPETTRTILVTCARGGVPFLAEELAELGFPALAQQESGVETRGTLADTMRLNLHLHCAQRVLFEIDAFPAATADELYARMFKIAWENIIPATEYFTIASFVHTPGITDSRFANVKCKDAVADRIRTKIGQRPNSGNERTGAVVFLFWNQGQARVYLDTSGEALAFRGYRKIPLDAPMQETLAAAVIRSTGWSGQGAFVNPMCGSGTLAIEAALAGLRRAPGLLRDNFAFMHLKGFEAGAWKSLCAKARTTPEAVLGGRIIATDLRPAAVDAARQNARAAGVERHIEFATCDFAESPLPGGGGVIIMNPEYGERMGNEADLVPLYKRIGDFFKLKCQGYTGYVFTGNLTLGKQVGLRATRKLTFFSGPLECRLLRFQIYAGSVRAKYAAGKSDAEPAGKERFSDRP